jgi:hypothetical protein
MKGQLAVLHSSLSHGTSAVVFFSFSKSMQFFRLSDSAKFSKKKKVQIFLRRKGPGDLDSSKHGRSVFSFLKSNPNLMDGQNINGSREIREGV